MLLANEVLDATRLGALADVARVTVAVDSEATIDAAARGAIREVLIDVDVGLPRCGCRPADAGLSNVAIRAFGEHGTPVFGVCLGLQCIGDLYGGDVVRAPHVMHGKTSEIRHNNTGVFAGLPNPPSTWKSYVFL